MCCRSEATSSRMPLAPSMIVQVCRSCSCSTAIWRFRASKVTTRPWQPFEKTPDSHQFVGLRSHHSWPMTKQLFSCAKIHTGDAAW